MTKGIRVNPVEAINVIGVTDENEVHTDGMHRFGLPELQIVGLPRFLYPPATGLLNTIAGYMLNANADGHKQVSVGESMEVYPGIIVRFEAAGTWKGHPMWRVVEGPSPVCEFCSTGRPHPGEEHDH